MNAVRPATVILSLQDRAIDPKELEHIAFCGHRELAHGIYRAIPPEERGRYASRYTFSEVIAGGIRKLRTFLAASAEGPATEEKAFIDGTVRLFLETCRTSGSFPRELFSSVLDWCEELTRLSLLKEALRHYDEILALDIKRFPRLYVRALLGKAALLNVLGSFPDAQAILRSLASRPYIIADRNQVPDVLFHLGKESLLRGEISAYKNLLFRGLAHFYTRVDQRRLFVDQIVRTYRRSYRVLIDGCLSWSDRLLFVLHRLYFGSLGPRPLRFLGIPAILRALVLGSVYSLNYLLPAGKPEPADTPGGDRSEIPASRRKRVLITRAMGGIGDLLMMTPGIHELKRRHPDREIHLAVPRRYFPVFEGNSDVTLVDIESDRLDARGYRRWFNFTDCPAARIESRTAPKVKRGRIEIFARALGLSAYAVRRMAKQPRYAVLPGERLFQQHFWEAHRLGGRKVIGVQLRSDEVYRDFPHMQRLVGRLTKDFDVILFDAEAITGYDDRPVVLAAGLPMRRAFALAAACDAIIAPDSSFVHLAAALDRPCVALFGPIDGALRTRHYARCRALDLKATLGCTPCWRNDDIPCRLTGMRSSVCMSDISIESVVQALEEVLNYPETV